MYHLNEENGAYYTDSVVKSNFNNWISNVMKD